MICCCFAVRHNLGDSTVDLSQFLKHEIRLVAEGDPQEATAESGT
jgi:hypothetical protein